MPDEQRTEHCYYTPSRIDWLLRNWGNLEALAESPSTAYGLTYKEPTPATPNVGARQAGFSGDKLGWACVRADVEKAWRTLLGDSFMVVQYVMFGYTLSGIAEGKRWGKQRVVDAYHEGRDRMAASLGWEPPTDE